MKASLTVSHVRDCLPDAVYIGRAMPSSRLTASPFANPAKLELTVTRATAIWRYHNHLQDSPDLIALLPELRGQTVACWCRRRGEARTPANVCHGDVLAVYLELFGDDELGKDAPTPTQERLALLDDRIEALFTEG